MQYILILEDDKDLAEGIQLALMDENLSFIICDTLDCARTAMEQQKIDLFILDINLPDGSGLNLCRELRKGSRALVVLLTAKDMELDIVTGLESGADDYITKPFSLMVLRARIRALLRRTGKETEKDYNKGDFSFHFETMDFYKNGNAVELSKTEQRILYYEEEDYTCYADIRWTIEAISNVLENAVKYSPEGSVIGVNVIKYDSFLCIEICDSGLGIAEKEKGLIFQRFYRSQEVKDILGFGIGLYLVREVLQKEGGYVKVQSRLGEGSKFQLFLSCYSV